MVGVWLVFSVVVSPVFRAQVPVITKLVLGSMATKSIILVRQGTIALLVAPVAVKLSVWKGLFGWGHSIEMRVCLWGIISLAIAKRG